MTKTGIVLELDNGAMMQCGLNYGIAIEEINKIMVMRGFKRLLPNTAMFFVSDGTCVDAVLTVQNLSADLNWFDDCLKHAKYLRITDIEDLTFV